jgi:DNA repair protein RecN (Recombination protein N)
MLTYLRIQNLAVVDDVTLELGPGLTVLTGETGAGKSIIIDGLALALGERAALDQVRAGANRATVEAVFSLGPGSELGSLLVAAGLGGEDGQVVVRRVLTPSGSRAYVNDSVVSQQQLKRIGDMLTDLHGQHEHQSLLAVTAHRRLLDRFGGAGELLTVTQEAYDRAVALGQRLKALQLDDRELAQRSDLLRFQLQEIDAAALQPREDEELRAERRRLAHAEELLAASGMAVAALYEDERSASSLIHQAEQRLERLLQLDPEVPVREEALSEARFVLEETARGLQAYQDGLDADPARLSQVEERLSAIETLKRKYGDSIESIQEHAQQARAELESLGRYGEDLEALEGELSEAVEIYDKAAAELRAMRKKAADNLQRQVIGELRQLAMEQAKFRVTVEARDGEAPPGLSPGSSRSGKDRVEFLLAANTGEKTGPLSRVASGGELSRVMLALKLSATEGDPLETLVFDEVDSGIGGGRVAERLAQRLAALAGTHQLLVVSHLPQVAAYADGHISIKKRERDGRTVVEVEILDAEQQVDELARMLGGLEITEATREHAREMLIATERWRNLHEEPNA